MELNCGSHMVPLSVAAVPVNKRSASLSTLLVARGSCVPRGLGPASALRAAFVQWAERDAVLMLGAGLRRLGPLLVGRLSVQGAGLEHAGAMEGRTARAWGQGPSCPRGEVTRQLRKLERKEARNPNESGQNQLKKSKFLGLKGALKRLSSPITRFVFAFLF